MTVDLEKIASTVRGAGASVGDVARAFTQRPPLELSPEAEAELARRQAAGLAAAVRKRDELERPKWLHAAGAPMAGQVVEERVPSVVRAWVASWRAMPAGCALIAGPVGTGKSMALQYAIGELWRRGRWDDEHAPRDWHPLASAARIRAVDLQRAVYDGRAGDRRAEWEAVGFLAIEDVRLLPESAWRLADELHALVDHRSEHGRATALTTNVAVDVFRQAYEPLHSRLVGSGGPGLVVVRGADQRLGAR